MGEHERETTAKHTRKTLICAVAGTTHKIFLFARFSSSLHNAYLPDAWASSPWTGKNHRPWESVKIFVHRWMSLFSSTHQCWLISKRQCFRARSQHSSSSCLVHSLQLNFAGRNAWDRSRPWMISFANYIIILTCIIRHKNRQKIPSDSLFCARTMNILIFLCLEFEFAFLRGPFSQWNAKKL